MHCLIRFPIVFPLWFWYDAKLNYPFLQLSIIVYEMNCQCHMNQILHSCPIISGYTNPNTIKLQQSFQLEIFF